MIIGAGIIGLTIARELKNRFPEVTVAIVEKEADVAFHSSGRNSGVLHAGFYYTEDSLKAKFTKEGNEEMSKYCDERNLQIKKCGKLVVARNEQEVRGLEELKRRADANGVELKWITDEDLQKYDPGAVTFKRALYSPTTSTVNPMEVCCAMKADNIKSDIKFYFNSPFKKFKGSVVYAGEHQLQCDYLINAAGLYADRIAQSFGFGKDYTIIPFRGNYIKYEKDKNAISMNIYPVPNLNNPFLGVHFTKNVEGCIKIGPTATPTFWRENYKGWKGFKLSEFFEILYYETKLFLLNKFNFRNLAFEEIRKYNKTRFIKGALGMVKNVDSNGFAREYMRPGIRAQLLNKNTLELVQDFVIEGDESSIHILNAVSPAFTCSLPFSRYVVDQISQFRKLQTSENKVVI